MDGIAKIVNACFVALRPVLHALWRDKCVEIGIFSDECWITSSGSKIIDIVRTTLVRSTTIGLKLMILKLCTRTYLMRNCKRLCLSC